jgi:hypothetical protein
MATIDRENRTADDILGKADALLARHRGSTVATRAERPPESTGDFPILTEVVQNTEPQSVDLGNISLDDLERELRLELLEQMSGEIEKLIEARVYERIGERLNEIMSQVRVDLAAEVSRVVQDTLSEAMSQALAQTKGDMGLVDPEAALPAPRRRDRAR